MNSSGCPPVLTPWLYQLMYGCGLLEEVSGAQTCVKTNKVNSQVDIHTVKFHEI